MLWLHLDPIPIVVCGRILSFSGAWAGPQKETIPHDSHKSAVNKDKHLFFTHLWVRSVSVLCGGPNSSRVKPFAKDTPNLHEGQQSTCS
jgi:hypothetical protein